MDRRGWTGVALALLASSCGAPTTPGPSAPPLPAAAPPEPPRAPDPREVVDALPEPFRGWFRERRGQLALGAVDEATARAWAAGRAPRDGWSFEIGVDPLEGRTWEAGPLSVSDVEARCCLELDRVGAPAVVDGALVVLDETDEPSGAWCWRFDRPEDRLSWSADAIPADPRALVLRPLGADRARLSLCGGHVDVVVGESVDQRWHRLEEEELARRLAVLAAAHPDLDVSTVETRWKGARVECRLGASRCDPVEVQVACADEKGWRSDPGGVGVLFEGSEVRPLAVGGMCGVTRRIGVRDASLPWPDPIDDVDQVVPRGVGR